MFANFDGEEPTVNFQNYIENNEILTDQARWHLDHLVSFR